VCLRVCVCVCACVRVCGPSRATVLCTNARVVSTLLCTTLLCTTAPYTLCASATPEPSSNTCSDLHALFVDKSGCCVTVNHGGTRTRHVATRTRFNSPVTLTCCPLTLTCFNLPLAYTQLQLRNEAVADTAHLVPKKCSSDIAKGSAPGPARPSWGTTYGPQSQTMRGLTGERGQGEGAGSAACRRVPEEKPEEFRRLPRRLRDRLCF